MLIHKNVIETRYVLSLPTSFSIQPNFLHFNALAPILFLIVWFGGAYNKKTSAQQKLWIVKHSMINNGNKYINKRTSTILLHCLGLLFLCFTLIYFIPT